MRLITSGIILVVAFVALSYRVFGFDDVADESASLMTAARGQLYSAHYDYAVNLYSRVVKQHPENADAWYGLVRAQLKLHHSHEAYVAAEQALNLAPQTAGAQTAAGFAMYRWGDLVKAEEYFRTALKINPEYPGALTGLASVCGTISMFKTGRDLYLKAWQLSPDDPELIVAHADTLKGDAHIVALEDALVRLNPASDDTRELTVHIANERALGGRAVRRLISPYQDSQIKIFRILDSPSRQRGLGIRVTLNKKVTASLMLDTGTSGISLSPKMAERAGLQPLGGVASEARGFGDGKAQASLGYLASEVRMGDVVFADYPVAVFQSALSPNFDGLIGADVFRQFLVKLDFAHLVASLEARPDGDPSVSDAPRDWNVKPDAGFVHVFRFHDRLAVPTYINGSHEPELFLVDSGSNVSLIDTEMARNFASVSRDPNLIFTGLQGRVNDVFRAEHITLVFGGFRKDNPILTAISMETTSDATGVGLGGVLGMPILSRLALTIDYLKGMVRFEYVKP